MSRPRPNLASLLALAALCAALVVPAGASAAVGPLSSFGSNGEGAGQLNGPEGTAVAADGNVYVAERSNNRISVFSPSGAFVRAFGKDVGGTGVDVCTVTCQGGTLDYPQSSAAGAFSTPLDVAFDASGRVFVSDSQNSRIDVFSAAGAFLYAFGKEVTPGADDVCDAETGCRDGLFSNVAGAFADVEGIGISGGLLYAADASNNRVDVFDLDGYFQFAFGEKVQTGGSGTTCTTVTGCQLGADEGPNSLDGPSDVAVAPSGNLYVTYNGFEAGVAVFSPQGAILGRFGDDPGPGALAAPGALAIAPSGLVHVADEVDDEVTTFSGDGTFLTSFTSDDATGIALDCRGAFWVSSYDDSKVVRYGEPGMVLPPCPPPVTPILVTVTPSNKFTFGKLKLNKQKGTATLVVKLPAPGKLVLKGNGLVKVTKTAKKAGDVKLAIKPKGKVKKKLDELGRAVAKAKLTFTPTGGSAATKRKSLTLKKFTG